MAPDDNPATPLPAPPCPICGKPGVSGHRPFCSARCRNVDLGRWLKGNYRIESDEGPEDGSGESDQQASPPAVRAKRSVRYAATVVDA